MAASAEFTPPIPMIGKLPDVLPDELTSRQLENCRPDMPPVPFAMIGFLLFESNRIPTKVLIMVKPETPASSTAFAICVISAAN